METSNSNVGAPLTILSDEEKELAKEVRSFAEAEILPLRAKMDHDMKMAPGLIKKFFEMGLMGIEIPEVYGGLAGTFFQACLVVEELSRIDASCGVLVDVQNTLFINALKRWGTPDQHKRYFPRIASDTVCAYALSESGSGSDAFALACSGKETGDHYVLNGSKLWITNADEAGLFLIFANINPSAGYKGITAFIVERDTAGFKVGKKEDKLGIRASSTCELILENVKVPKANVIGEVGKGYKIAIETLNEGRIGIASQMIGLSQGSLEAGMAYIQERKQFGQPLSSFQGIQFQLAQCATELEAARLMTYNAARLKDAGLNFIKEAAMAKLFASQVANRLTSQVVEFFGGNVYTKEYPAEKFFRDSKIGT
ncbi:MAG: acyl-CoA dehydrogenase family protein, partial [Planctomycetota bacterium]